MPSRIERDHDFSGEFGNATVVFARKSSAGKKGVHCRDGRGGVSERASLRHQPRCELFQNTRDLRRFLFPELHQAIVDLDRFQRLDEKRLPRSAGRMDHPLEVPPLRCPNRDHVAFIALGNVIVATLAAARAQNALERLLQIFSRACDSFANAPQNW